MNRANEFYLLQIGTIRIDGELLKVSNTPTTKPPYTVPPYWAEYVTLKLVKRNITPQLLNLVMSQMDLNGYRFVASTPGEVTDQNNYWTFRKN